MTPTLVTKPKKFAFEDQFFYIARNVCDGTNDFCFHDFAFANRVHLYSEIPLDVLEKYFNKWTKSLVKKGYVQELPPLVLDWTTFRIIKPLFYFEEEKQDKTILSL